MSSNNGDSTTTRLDRTALIYRPPARRHVRTGTPATGRRRAGCEHPNSDNGSQSHSRYSIPVDEDQQRAAVDLHGVLADNGIRSTGQRLRVLEVLAAEPADATAQEIHARLREQGERVGLATVYRTVALLSESGVIDALAHRPGEMCYRLCAEGHHH